jgi:hypothetical protein
MFNTEILQRRIADLALNLPAPEARRLWSRITGPGFFDADEAEAVLAQADTEARLDRYHRAHQLQQGGTPRGQRSLS